MNNLDKSLKTLAKGTSLIFIGMIISKILTYTYRIIIARINPEDYGLISIGLAIFGLVTLISLFGMNVGIIRYISYYRSTKEYKKLMGAFLSVVAFEIIISISLSLLVFLFADKIAIEIFSNPELGPIIKILMLGVPFGVLATIFLSVANAFEKIEYDVISRCFVENFVKVGSVLVFVYWGYKALGAAYAYTIAIIASFFVSLYFVRKILKYYKWEVNGQFKKLFKYSWPLLLSNFLVFVYHWTDTFMLAYFKDATIVGIYNIALPTANLLYIFPYGLMALFVPVITNLFVKKDKESFKSIYYSTTKWILFFNSLIFIIFIVLGKDIIRLLFGEVYISAFTAMIILASGYYLSYLTLNSTNLLLIYKKTKYIFAFSFISSMFNVILNLILIPKFGIIGAAIATSSSYLLHGLLVSIKAYSLTKIIPLKVKFLTILPIMLITGIACTFIKPLFNINFVYLLIILFITTIIYISLLFGLRMFDKNDITIIKLFKKWKK